MPTRFTAEGLQLHDGASVPVYAGEFHYWRADRKSWRASLEALKALGLGIVSTVVPWSVHERAIGQFDFSGNLDLGAFLDEAHALGLLVMVRPGPHCNAQLTQFGFPERIVADVEMQALGGRNTPIWLPAPPRMFPVPSYASAKFQREVRAWYARVAEVVVPRIHPAGPLVAMQIDHEMQMFWRLAAFEGDYHPDALVWWREYAGEIEPPRKYDEDDMPRLLKWQHFKEEYVRRSLVWLGEAADAAGFGELARYHNLPPGRPAHYHQPMVEAATGGVAGMDFYDLSSGYSRVRERAIYLASNSVLPFAPELGVGGPPWFPTMSEADEQNVALGALAGGIRAFSFYMAVERERWYGGAVDERGRATASADWIAPLLASLREIDFPSLRRQTPIALVLSRAETRAAVVSCSLHSATHALTDWLNLGPEGHAAFALDRDARLYSRWFDAIGKALDRAEVPYQLIDETCLHTLGAETKALILPTLRRVDGAAWAAVHALAGGGMPVVIGPKLPREDEVGQPLGVDAVRPPGSGLIDEALLEDIDQLSAALLDLAGELSDLWIAPEHERVDCSVYCDARGVARALFVGNRGSEETGARLNLPSACTLVDAISAETIAEAGGTALIGLAPHQVRFFLLR